MKRTKKLIRQGLAELSKTAGGEVVAQVIQNKSELEAGTYMGEGKLEEIKEMNERMDIPEHFDFIKDEDIPTIVKRALKEGNPLYPVPKIMNEADCEAVIRRLMK